MAYAAARLPASVAVVRTNRSAPPDMILREVHQRSGGKLEACMPMPNTLENAEQVPGMRTLERRVVSIQHAAKVTFPTYGLVQCFLYATCASNPRNANATTRGTGLAPDS